MGILRLFKHRISDEIDAPSDEEIAEAIERRPMVTSLAEPSWDHTLQYR